MPTSKRLQRPTYNLSIFFWWWWWSSWEPVQRELPPSSPWPWPEEWQSQCWPLLRPAQEIYSCQLFSFPVCFVASVHFASTWKRKVWSWSLVLVAFTAANTPATATLAVPWMSSLNVQNLHNKVKYNWTCRKCTLWLTCSDTSQGIWRHCGCQSLQTGSMCSGPNASLRPVIYKLMRCSEMMKFDKKWSLSWLQI